MLITQIGLSTTARCLAAQNFIMPALSPTMTEGNIASWRVKEGDSFTAGDVLLEIETDKATMDVEAQDDGIMFKIMSEDGSKSVAVGSRIAVLAESGDDISSLEIPPEPKTQQQQQEKQPAKGSTKTEKSSQEGSSAEKKQPAQSSKGPSNGNESYEQKYPLMPSVEHLVKANGISKDDVSKIKPTGPNGRLLKGDVLAYMGTINSEAPSAVSSYFDKLSHLDLSNIKVAESKPAPKKAEAPAEKGAPPVPEDLEVNVPISLAKVVEVQKKIQDTLGVFLPVSTFISRAAEVANDELPLAHYRPTANELFDAVLGLDKVKAAKGSRGVYLPQISAIPAGASFTPKAAPRAAKRDIIDDIAGTPAKNTTSSMVSVPTVPGLSTSGNVFTLTVPEAEEERAYVFLQRCKVILEEDPGRLVL
jgi:pyruvate/2-oxoglutarate dehydrogenase complex dihydrolipoamide acyltransferase (E2) component